uniref:Ribosomal silencing factor RsfS n=1 Tax=candidate division WOR-3 bacterium TaxID=2052148 RepID=A0A7V0Z3N4_UNCW3
MLKKDSNKEPIGLAKELARIISDKKGEDIIIFDLRDISPITDFFVIATGLSDIHNKTIAEYLSKFEKPEHIEGIEGGGWILIDYIDVIVHIFSKEAREFYGLERLWGDAPRVNF